MGYEIAFHCSPSISQHTIFLVITIKKYLDFTVTVGCLNIYFMSAFLGILLECSPYAVILKVVKQNILVCIA